MKKVHLKLKNPRKLTRNRGLSFPSLQFQTGGLDPSHPRGVERLCRPAAATHMAEDHSLSDGDGPIQVAQGLELLVSVTAQDVILLDGVQRLLLTLQFDNIGVWDHFLRKLPHGVFKGGGEKQHLAVPGQHPVRRGPGNFAQPPGFYRKEQKLSLPCLGGLWPQQAVRGEGKTPRAGGAEPGWCWAGLGSQVSFLNQAGSIVSADEEMAHQTSAAASSRMKNPTEASGGVSRSPWLKLLPLDADALILVALSSYHHVRLIQNKHLDLLGVNELELGAPVQDSARSADDNLLTDLLTSFHCGDDMFSVGISKAKAALESKPCPSLQD